MDPTCRGPTVFDPGAQLQIAILVKKTTPFQRTLFVFFSGPDQERVGVSKKTDKPIKPIKSEKKNNRKNRIEKNRINRLKNHKKFPIRFGF
jgi:hypothetical protein